MSRELRVRSYAKINLGLEITGRRDDGYHDLVSVMQTISLADTLIFNPSDHISVDSGVPELAQEGDLIWKAAVALRDTTGTNQGIHVRVEKEIPSKAGLGGGSSNCATTLLVLSKIWKIGMPAETLAKIAATLGSDIAFFLHGGTALTRGRGEMVESLPDAPSRWVLLVNPRESLSTASVFQELRAEEHTNGSATLRLASREREGILDYKLMRNNLSLAAQRLCPSIKPILTELREYSSATLMSGSGSTSFGLFENKQEARAVEEMFVARNYNTLLCAFIPGHEVMREKLKTMYI